MNLFRSKHRSVPLPGYQGWDVVRWSKSESHVAWMRSLLATPEWAAFWNILTGSVPRGWPQRSNKPVDPVALAVEHGRIQGYLDCLELIRSMAEFAPKQVQHLEPDYSTPPLSNADDPDAKTPAEKELDQWFPHIYR